MPVYEFQCICGVQFERRMSVSQSQLGHKCPNCDCIAEKMVSTFSCTYSFQTDGTIKPHNTGYSGIDTDYDRIIGKDAEEKWKICKEREKIKEKIIKENKITKHNLTVVDGEYKIISDEESDKIRRIRGFNNSVINLQNRKKTGESIG